MGKRKAQEMPQSKTAALPRHQQLFKKKDSYNTYSFCIERLWISITKTRLFKLAPSFLNFTTKKWKFSDKKFWCFHISAQNIDCGYSLEPPKLYFGAEIKKNNVYPCKPQFYYLKVGFKGVKIIWSCFRDGLYIWWKLSFRLRAY